MQNKIQEFLQLDTRIWSWFLMMKRLFTIEKMLTVLPFYLRIY